MVVERYAIAYENKSAYVVLAKSGEKKTVKVQPYGSGYVKVLQGLEGGELLKQLTPPKKSGQKSNKKGENGFAPPMGGPAGAGAPGGGSPGGGAR